MSDTILVDISDATATVTLNRPDVLNSFNREMAGDLQQALAAVGSDDGVRCVVLTGAGRAFCAGQDLSEVVPEPGNTSQLADIVEGSYNPIIRQIRALEKPVLCAVNGVAAGAGANLAFACDIVVASDAASFIQSFSRVGLIPDSGGTFFLPRIVGLQKAAELMMLGDRISADQACALGLIARVFPAGEFDDSTSKLASELAAMPTRGLALTKQALNASFTNDVEAQLTLEATLQQVAGSTEDYAEGVDAFINKRKPKYSGK